MSALFVVSDIDRTLVPVGGERPVPGIAQLLFELVEAGASITYVTARPKEVEDETRTWLVDRGLPDGVVVGGDAKVRDIARLIDDAPRVLLLGDSRHRDPEVFRELNVLFGGRIAAAIILRVNNMNPRRGEGLDVVPDYAHAAALLVARHVLDEDAAWRVIDAARLEGLEVDDEALDAQME